MNLSKKNIKAFLSDLHDEIDRLEAWRRDFDGGSYDDGVEAALRAEAENLREIMRHFGVWDNSRID